MREILRTYLLITLTVLQPKGTIKCKTSKPNAFSGPLRKLVAFIPKQIVQQVFPGILIWLVRYLRKLHDAGVGSKSFCSERRFAPIQVTYQLMGVNEL
jgi:hypothetical protein